MNEQILIVEDEADLLELLEYRLSKNGYETIGFLNTKNVKRILKEEQIDLIVMDRNLPDIEGSEFIAMLRDQGMNVPVIFLSAKNSQSDIHEGFLNGGDDYLCKPFDMQELLLRIQALLKRSSGNHQVALTLQHKDIKLDLQTHSVIIEERVMYLSKLEFEILKTFIENRNRVLSRSYLLEKIWKEKSANQEKTVNVAINRLKEKIDPHKRKNYIRTIRGLGYMME